MHIIGSPVQSGEYHARRQTPFDSQTLQRVLVGMRPLSKRDERVKEELREGSPGRNAQLNDATSHRTWSWGFDIV